jgi:hypothetical protein
MAGMTEALDHPIVFLFAVTIGVFSLGAIIQWALKAGNFGGGATVFGG